MLPLALHLIIQTDWRQPGERQQSICNLAPGNLGRELLNQAPGPSTASRPPYFQTQESGSPRSRCCSGHQWYSSSSPSWPIGGHRRCRVSWGRRVLSATRESRACLCLMVSIRCHCKSESRLKRTTVRADVFLGHLELLLLLARSRVSVNRYCNPRVAFDQRRTM